MKKLFRILIVLMLALICSIGGFVIGRSTASQRENSCADSNASAFYQTFYAEIEKINGQTLLVKGLDVNDINGRGAFCVSVDEDTILEWRYESISLEELEVGDTISITHTGNVGETYPVQIFETERIQLLDDEK